MQKVEIASTQSNQLNNLVYANSTFTQKLPLRITKLYCPSTKNGRYVLSLSQSQKRANSFISKMNFGNNIWKKKALQNAKR